MSFEVPVWQGYNTQLHQHRRRSLRRRAPKSCAVKDILHVGNVHVAGVVEACRQYMRSAAASSAMAASEYYL